jgi:hypothetical protein
MTRSPWLGPADPEQRFEHRGISLFDLQEQRVAAASSHHQGDPAASADASDADHLDRHVVKLELLEEHAPIKLEGVAVGAKQPADSRIAER